MRRYETTFIVDPDIAEDSRKVIFDRSKELVEQFKGFLVKFDEWGAKKLAYEIKKKTRGYYVCMDFCGTGDLVNELERSFRLDEKVLKFMTIVLGDVVLEDLKAELSKAEEEAEAAAAAEESAEEAKEEAAAPAETVEEAKEEVEAPATESVEEEK